jgi:Flp pilus assembly protein TadG
MRRGYSLLRLMQKEDGQVLPWMALLTVLFLGMAGLTIDLGHAYVAFRELQASTDAAALAGAYAMSLSDATTATIDSEVCTYSSNTTAGTNCPVGLYNRTPNLPNVTVQTKLACVLAAPNYVEAPCIPAPVGGNVVQVTQTAVVPTIFIQALSAFGINAARTLTFNAVSTAAIQSGGSPGVNIAVVIDTTASMKSKDTDANCGNTEIYCALQGFQQLLGEIYPCTSGSSLKAGCLGAYDQVSLFTFPNIQESDASYDTSCPSKNPAIPAYSYTPIPASTNTSWSDPTGSTYQVTTPGTSNNGFEDNYSTTNSANGGLNTSSGLAIAAGAGSCGGLQAPGGDGTYIASAMYAATTALQAAQAANPKSTSALILLTDGGANSSSFDPTFTATAKNPPATPSTFLVPYPSTINQCQQTVDAGQYATSLGITVYTIAYGASNQQSACTTDTTTTTVKGKPVTTANVISPCTELEETASSPATFYSDATASEDPGACNAPDTTGVGLNGIFKNIGSTFLKARLVPNSVTAGS